MHQNHSYSPPVTTVSSGDARLMSVPSSHIDLIGQEESEGQQRHGNRYAQANGREGGQSEEPGEQEILASTALPQRRRLAGGFDEDLPHLARLCRREPSSWKSAVKISLVFEAR